MIKLNDDAKKKLIIKLTESINALPGNKENVDSLTGVWDDDRDADIIIKDIRNSRAAKEKTGSTRMK
ncbi:MAG: hypothetical protein ABI844_03095 [Saprospiraceae bacterium]